MALNSVIKFFHVAALAHFTGGLYYDFAFIAPLEMKIRGFTFGNQLCYITILASEFKVDFLPLSVAYQFFQGMVQVIYYAIALMSDFMPSPTLKRFRNTFFASLAWPLALETSFMYWTMRTIDRELVFPKSLDEFFPLWLDICLHSNVTVFVFLEMILNDIKYPQRKVAIRGLIVFLLGYLVWLYVIKNKTGKWVYGILGILSGPQRIGFFIAAGLVSIGLYFVGEFMSKCCSGSEKVIKVEKKKKKK